MREWIAQQGIVFYIFAAVTILGVIASVVANRVYKRLAKEADSIENANNRLVKYIKLKYSSFYKIGVKPNDTWSMVGRYLYKYRIGPLTLETWSNLSLVAMGVIGATAAIRVISGFYSGELLQQMYTLFAMAILCVGILAVQRKAYCFETKKENFRCVMCDYLNNYLRNKMEFGAALNEKANKKAEQAAATSIGGKGENIGRPKPYQRSCGDMTARDQDEELDAKIVEDILKEFLN